MSRYLVTGATGFLGAHLAASLEAHGHEVVRFARSTGGDVLDGAAVRAAAEGCAGAFHCAGKVSRKAEDAELLYRLHVEGTKTVLDACAAAGVGRVVVASTSGTVAVSEKADRVATEDDEAPMGLLARWPYYRSKLFAERAALERSRDGLAVVSVNPSLLLGPGDVNGSSTEDVRLFLEGAIPAVPAGGLSFVDARDAAEAMRLAMERGRAGERYLVGACNCTMREFFAKLARVSGVAAPWMPMPRSREVARLGARLLERVAARMGVPPRVDAVSVEMAQCFWYLDAGKAERELGWTARDPGETLHDTVEDLRARGVVWPRVDDRVDERPDESVARAEPGEHALPG
ncbi:MAG TPA: NAD-dependent epimerase/dehydratase family protein [Polyangiaceae bacterium]|jgi:dihydroflavonol-4-reductase